MADSKHTPGPWLNSTLSIIPGQSTPGVFCLIAEVRMRPRSGASSDEGEANARLIAAAPDLLDACRRALEVLRDRQLWDKERKAWAALEVAIGKATGKIP